MRSRRSDEASCIGCEEGSIRVKFQQRRQQQLFVAYAAQQEELQATSGALGRTRAEVDRLRDCVRDLQLQAATLAEAAATGEAAKLEKEALGNHVTHLQVQQTNQTHVCCLMVENPQRDTEPLGKHNNTT